MNRPHNVNRPGDFSAKGLLMDTDPNPFRDSPDSDRSASPTEAPDDSARDFTADEESGSTGDPSPMSDDNDDSDDDAEDGSTRSDDTTTETEPTGSGQSAESGSSDASAPEQTQPV